MKPNEALRRYESSAITTNHDSDLLTIAEATRLLRVSRVTLHRWLRDGRLPAFHVGPKAVRIRRGDLVTIMRPIQQGEGSQLSEVQPMTLQTAVRPLTDEEKAQQRAALEGARALITRMRARQGGIPADESWPLIRQAREERERRQV